MIGRIPWFLHSKPPRPNAQRREQNCTARPCVAPFVTLFSADVDNERSSPRREQPGTHRQPTGTRLVRSSTKPKNPASPADRTGSPPPRAGAGNIVNTSAYGGTNACAPL